MWFFNGFRILVNMRWFKKDPLKIIVFQSYGTSSHLYVRGRALEDESIDLEGKHPVRLLIEAYKRFDTDEIKHAHLLLKLPNNLVIETKTDDEGYFLIDETVENLISMIPSVKASLAFFRIDSSLISSLDSNESAYRFIATTIVLRLMEFPRILSISGWILTAKAV